ncbi:MAG: hypothetical protein Q9183_006087 [Haloplaca sp. 2 TL-2023]
MDPISVSASILGLLGAAAKISEVLRGFVKGVKDAPALAQRVFTEVEDLTLCFRGLQEFVNSERSNFPSSTRLQEAQQAAESLATIVNDVLTTNQALARRLEDLHLPTTLKHQSAPSALESALNEEEGFSTCAGDRHSCTTCATTIVEEADSRNATFERDLRRSRVYSKASTRFQRRSDVGLLSLSSSPECSIGSAVSGLSLADVSNISVVSLPISVQVVVNRHWYQPPVAIERITSRYPDQSSLHRRQTGKVLLLGGCTTLETHILRSKVLLF